MSMVKKIAGVLILFAVLAGAAWSQNVEELYSPYVLSFGGNSVSMQSPYNSIFNPAAAGLKQRVTVDLNYIGIFPFGIDAGLGTAVNAGLCIPTNAGVWTTSLHFVGDSFTTTNIGTLFQLHTSFAKDLFPTFLIGIGLDAEVGVQSDVWDWGLGGSLGFIHIADQLLFMKDFAWGISVRNMGKRYNPTGDNTYFPKAFTPALGLNFKLVKVKDFYWQLAADVSVPDFAGVRFMAGTELGLFDTLFVRAKVELDSFQMANAAAPRSFPMAFGLAVVFKTDIKDNIAFLNISERGWNRSDVAVDGAWAPLANGQQAIGLGLNLALGVVDTTPPVIDMDIAERTWISPNFDGVQDDLIVPLKITDEHYVKGYTLTVADSTGKVVKTIANKEERPENVNVENVFQRLVYVRSGIKVPETLIWDGKSDAGTVVPDGTYTVTMEAVDDNGNKGVSQTYTVIVKNAPPTAGLSVPNLVFSPNGTGGARTDLQVNITGSKEDLWTLSVIDDKGAAVYKKEWKDSSPASFAWDGAADAGTQAPDGVYSVTLASADKAGNKASYRVDNIIIDTKQASAFVTAGADGLTPNGDPKFANITLTLKVTYRQGVKSWYFAVLNDQDQPQRTLKGLADTPIPETFAWNGRDENGDMAPDGAYTGRLMIEYDRGTKLEAESKPFVLNAGGPKVDLTLNPVPFSPDNDGMEDEENITTKVSGLSPIASWKMEITDPTGIHFTSFSGIGTPKETIMWDGKSDKGELVEAASDYKLDFTITDTLGNKASLTKTIMVDVLVIRDGDKLRIRIPSITFKAYTDNYVDVPTDAAEKNQWVIGRLAVIFKKYSTYNIQIEGHAVSEYWADPARAKKEQEEELLPLSKKRAEAIKTALIGQGIEASRISTVGVGGARPIVPFSDLVNRWKDRRVEFILIKK
ncbi:MAG: OmpA family protein [Spirochaetales bacterium]|nr:OmpA family protein [Spirochaetales bacterium]